KPEDILKPTASFTPNDIEFLAITKTPLFASVEDKMVVTKGAEGVQFKTATGELRKIPAFSVDVVDTTGAGDTFNGVLATELGRTNDIDQAVKFANAAAALSIQKIGAQGGMPYREEVETFLKKH